LWEKKKKEKTARVFNAGLLAISQFASGRSCDRPTRSRFSVAFLGPRANSELVTKFQVALHAENAAIPMVTLKIWPYTNVTLTLGWITLFIGENE
jgi:D-Tyr-tRNAtyr deacylase